MSDHETPLAADEAAPQEPAAESSAVSDAQDQFIPQDQHVPQHQFAPVDPNIPPPPPVWQVAPQPHDAWVGLQAKQQNLVLGPTLWISGALLWAYVVVGEFVVAHDFPEALAILVVLGILAANWRTAVRHPPEEPRKRLHLLGPGIFGIGLWALLLILTTLMLGSSHRNSIAALTVMLWFFGTLAYGVGRYIARTPRQPRTLGQRAITVALWCATAIGTLVAIVSALARA